jgi:hypothetical protein
MMPQRSESISRLACSAGLLSTSGHTPMATTEHTINDAIADLLRGTRRAWHDSDIVSSENTGQIKGSSARPDILVVEPNVSPVVIETEVLPAVTVETEAASRLGAQLKKTGRRILSSVAVRLPVRLREKSGKGSIPPWAIGCAWLGRSPHTRPSQYLCKRGCTRNWDDSFSSQFFHEPIPEIGFYSLQWGFAGPQFAPQCSSARLSVYVCDR